MHQQFVGGLEWSSFSGCFRGFAWFNSTPPPLLGGLFARIRKDRTNGSVNLGWVLEYIWQLSDEAQKATMLSSLIQHLDI